MERFIRNHVDQVKPLEKQANLAHWQAATTGKEAAYEKSAELEFALRKIYSDKDDFKQIAELKTSKNISDPVLNRQLVVLYNDYLENHQDSELLKQMIELSSEIEKKFSHFRGRMNGTTVSNNEIKSILKNEIHSQKRKDAWLASKQVGEMIADDVIQMVKLRNQAARSLGYDNYHKLSLAVGEQTVEELDQIFNHLYALTNQPFRQLKSELDHRLASMYNINVKDLMPWHYHDPFFQETPMVYDLDLDKYYKDKSVEKLATEFFKSIGLPVESILKNSDLYERAGKNPHAFCTDIDREGDVRILCNLQNNESWMETILHELGHAVYDKYMDHSIPYLLREPAHPFTTEAIAMLFGRLSRNPVWMESMLGLTKAQRDKIEKVAEKYMRLKQLIFARWAMVMYNFEKQLYKNPDQDLNRLWWDLVEKYQFISKPQNRHQPDWAAKIHIALYPCYYHNYLLGELLASQISERLSQLTHSRDINEINFVEQKIIGEFLRDNIFETANLYRWNEMIEQATGEPLTPEYFVKQFVRN